MPSTGEVKDKLEVVLKGDSYGSTEAIAASLYSIKGTEVTVDVIQSGVGPISKSDLVMALTGSRLVLGFNVDVMPKLEQFIKENGIEVRLYRVIYNLIEDVRRIAKSLTADTGPTEQITGRAQVIALFKSTPKGIILGCRVLEGSLQLGKKFHIISAMGPVYTGKIESLQIEKQPVKQATAGQEVGLKVADFNRAKQGDFVECFETVQPKDSYKWRPRGAIIHSDG